MKKEEFIARYGQAAYAKMQQQVRDWPARHREERKVYMRKRHALHREEDNARTKVWHAVNPNVAGDWRAANPEKVKVNNQEWGRKGGKRYEEHLEYEHTGLQGERNKVRNKHWYQYRAIKESTPNSVFHHEWIPGTAKYRGVALVDKEMHRRGIIKVIKLLEGQITLFTEKEIKKG